MKTWPSVFNIEPWATVHEHRTVTVEVRPPRHYPCTLWFSNIGKGCNSFLGVSETVSVVKFLEVWCCETRGALWGSSVFFYKFLLVSARCLCTFPLIDLKTWTLGKPVSPEFRQHWHISNKLFSTYYILDLLFYSFLWTVDFINFKQTTNMKLLVEILFIKFRRFFF